jgi:hypothetical protein
MTQRFALPLIGVLALLGGCATSPQPMDGAAHLGTWIVTDAFASGGVSDAASAPRGQTVPMEAARAGDAAGRVCPSPRYAEDMASLGSVIGAASPQGPRLTEPVRVLTVECAGRPFATYAMVGDGVLLTRYGGWVLRLEHGERLAANPAPMMAEPAAPPMALAAMPAPMPAPAAEPAAAAPAPKTPKTLVYLASYKTEAWARKGWGILAERSATLKASEPVMKSVEIKGKGTFVRLFAGAGDATGGKMICKELGKTIAECGVAGRQ